MTPVEHDDMTREQAPIQSPGEVVAGAHAGARTGLPEAAGAGDTPAYRVADILIDHELGRVAVEIQGARPLVSTIAAREAHYAAAGVGVLWVFDGTRPERLVLQGFQDIALSRGGVVYAWDPAVAAKTARTRRSHLRRWRIAEVDDALVIAEDTVVPLTDAVLEALAWLPRGSAAPGHLKRDPTAAGAATPSMSAGAEADHDWWDMALVWSPPRDPAALPGFVGDLLAAIRDGDRLTESEAGAKLLKELEPSESWEDACAYGLPAAMGALATLITGRRGLPYAYRDDEAAATFHAWVASAASAPWVPPVVDLAQAYGGEVTARLLGRPTTARLVAAARERSEARRFETGKIIQLWGAALTVTAMHAARPAGSPIMVT